jgi:4-hydroxyphenylpyruvate dioxygenase-like putative hemolysin
MKSGEVKIIPPDRIMLSDITHVCVAVRDVEKTAALYSSLFGIGPFTIRQVHTPADRATVHGAPTAYTLKFGYAKTGAVTLELVETVEGETIYKEYVAQHGEGIHHIGFRAPPPVDQELEQWQKQGIEPLQVNYRDDPKYGWAYMDTQRLVGCLIEIVCDPALGWWESLALGHDLKGPLGRA